MTTQKPVPHETDVSRPYWQAARRGVLSLQRCGDCGKTRHYPQLVCDACHSLEVEWIDASGRGALHSWTVAHHAFHGGFADEVPYTLAVVDLEEGPRALGRLTGVEPGALAIGLPLAASFVEEPNGAPTLTFAPAGSAN